MKSKAHFLLIGSAALILAGGFLTTAGRGAADDDKELRDAVLKTADALEKKNLDAAKKLAEPGKKAELEDLMGLFSPRTKKGGGLGVGPVPGAITPDGIEKKIIDLTKKPLSEKDAETQAEAIARASYVAAAIAEILVDKCPVQSKQGDKDPAKWRTWAKDMEKASLELADAAKTKKPADIIKAANKLNDACINCHNVFK